MNDVAPVAAADRLEVLDALRGVALLGILAANLLIFAGVVYLDDPVRDAMPLPKLDAAVRWLQVILVEGKFYGIFSLLFGVGAALQLGRWHATDGGRLFRRRMLVLVAIGLLHSLIWMGDILLLYACLGLLLPACWRASDHRLLRLGLTLFGVAIGWQYLVLGSSMLLDLPYGWPFSLGWEYVDSLYPAWHAAQASGDLAEMFRFNAVAVWAERWPGLLVSGRPFKVLGFFLLGMWAARQGIPGAIDVHRARLWQLAQWGLAVGLPASLLFAAIRFLFDATPLFLLSSPAEAVGILALTIGYAACVLLIWERWHPAVLRLFAPLGRMALTAYLSQSLICLYGLSGAGLGWFMEIGAAAATALALPVIALQLLLAHWWLARYQFGPVEWAWRSVSYGVAQPMRRTAAGSAGALEQG